MLDHHNDENYFQREREAPPMAISWNHLMVHCGGIFE